MNWSVVGIVLTLVGWGVTFGICKQQIKENAEDISELKVKINSDIAKVEERQTKSENLLQSINTQLVELNVKMNLLMKGKITMEQQNGKAE